VCILGQGGVVMPSGQDTADFHFSAIAVRNYETMLKVPLARVLVSVSGCHCMAYLRNFSHWLPAIGFRGTESFVLAANSKSISVVSFGSNKRS